jgi:long-chain fatty acid transport protein
MGAARNMSRDRTRARVRLVRIVRSSPFLPLALAAALPAGDARASGFLTDQFGSDHGQPALPSAYAVYFNPGAMAGMYGTELTVDGVVAARSLDYDRSLSALSFTGSQPVGGADYVAANSGKAHLFNVLTAPFVGFVTDFGGSAVRLGLGVYVPFGGEVSWDKNSAYASSAVAPGAYDGTQRWSSISALTSSIYSTAAVAYRFDAARLGVGASFSVIRTGLNDVRARDPDGSDDILASNGEPKEGRSDLDVSGVQLGAAVGAYWEATEDGALRIGASYTSRPTTVGAPFGTMRLNGTFKLDPASPGGNPVDLLQAYPDIVRVGVAWRIHPDVEMRLDGDWQRWSAFKDQCIVANVPGTACNVDSNGVAVGNTSDVKLDLPRNWKDSFKVRLGTAYWVVPQAELFASIALESSPSEPRNEDALIFDSTRLSGTVGARYAFSKHVVASLSYTDTHIVPVTVTDSAFATFPPGVNKSPSANGSYSSEIYIFDGAVSYRF